MYKFVPILKTLVWGTELWLVSSVPGNESVVADGPYKGKSINDVYGGEFPLLIKFIDAHDDLSIQVHPNDELAMLRHNCKGKTEMWFVREADQGAHLLSGLTQEISKEDFAKRVEENTVTDVLGKYDVHKGDVFFLPAGRIHAIGGGSHIAEIQQTSNITYRIYDYGRKGLDGKPRELHTQQALDAIDYAVLPDYRTHYTQQQNSECELVKCEFFETSLFNLDKEYTKDLSSIDAWYVVICLKGEGTINGEVIKEGDVFLLTDKENQLNLIPSASGMQLLTTFAPKQ